MHVRSCPTSLAMLTGGQVTLKLSEDGSGIGAALVAAVAHQQSKCGRSGASGHEVTANTGSIEKTPFIHI